jgi:hypothetical protein
VPGLPDADPSLPRPPSHAAYAAAKAAIDAHEGGLLRFSEGYRTHGFVRLPNGDVRYREWIPGAVQAFLTGDFSTHAPPPHAPCEAEALVQTWVPRACAPSIQGGFLFAAQICGNGRLTGAMRSFLRWMESAQPSIDAAALRHVGNHARARRVVPPPRRPRPRVQDQGADHTRLIVWAR